VDWHSIFVPALGIAQILMRHTIMYLALFAVPLGGETHLRDAALRFAARPVRLAAELVCEQGHKACAKALAPLFREADAVVGNDKHQPVRFARQIDPHMAGAAPGERVF